MSDPTFIIGTDLSHYNTVTNYQQLLAVQPDGHTIIQWAAAKATQGDNFTDPSYGAKYAGLGGGKLRTFLAYHWLSPGIDLNAQLHNFFTVVGGQLAAGFGIMFDCEERGLTEEMVYQAAVIAIDNAKRPPVIYTGVHVDGGAVWLSARIRALGCPYVLAAWTNEGHARQLAAPYWGEAWQYGGGSLLGVSGSVDMDRVDHPEAFDGVCAVDGVKPLPMPVTAPTKEIAPPHPVNDPANELWGLYPFGPKPTLEMARSAKWSAQPKLVKYLQAAIHFGAGHGGLAIDGWWGPVTDRAVRDVQTFFHLRVDSICGPITWGVVDYLALTAHDTRVTVPA